MKKLNTLFRIVTVLACAALLHVSSADAQINTRAQQRSAFNNRRFYDHRGGYGKNALLLQLVQLPQTGRLTYQRTIGKKLAVGANGSYQYAGKEAGTTKGDVFGKWFISHRSPIGMYMYGAVGYARFNNHTFLHRYTENVEGVEVTYDPRTSYVVEEKASFNSVTGAFGLGFQNVVGIDRRVLIDIAVGYQFYKVPSRYKASVTANNRVYGKFDANNSILGPASPLQVKFGLGFLF